MRGRGIGKALLLTALEGLREIGYAYGIIGGVGPAEFYAKACGAVMIEGSTPGIYAVVTMGTIRTTTIHPHRATRKRLGGCQRSRPPTTTPRSGAFIALR